MTWLTQLLWNRLNGTYFKDGIDVQGDITCQPNYKVYTDTMQANGTKITIPSEVLIDNVLRVKNIFPTGVMEIGGDYAITYIDMRCKEGTSDYDVRLECQKGVGSPGTGTLSILSAVNNISGATAFSSTLTLLGNLIVNSTNITPTILSYLSTLSSNVQTQINNISTAISALQSASNSLTNVFATGILELGGDYNFTYIDLKCNGGDTDADVRLGCDKGVGYGTLTIDSAVSIFNGASTFSSSLKLLGNLIVNSTNITPTILSYLSTLTSNVQTQINNINSVVSTLQSGSLTNIFASGIMELGGDNAFTYIDMRCNGGNLDADVRLGCDKGNGTYGSGIF